jgi:hypothetical protein
VRWAWTGSELATTPGTRIAEPTYAADMITRAAASVPMRRMPRRAED